MCPTNDRPNRHRNRRGRRDHSAFCAQLTPTFTPDQHFLGLIRQALRDLPPGIKEQTHTLTINVSWLPPAPEAGSTGIQLGTVHDESPDGQRTITIYRQPVVDHCEHPSQLSDVVNMVVWDLVHEALQINPDDPT